VCVPDPEKQGCLHPFHDRRDVNDGGPHAHLDALADIAGGRMDGFVAQAEKARTLGACTDPNGSECLTSSSAARDVMGYHDGPELVRPKNLGCPPERLFRDLVDGVFAGAANLRG
jgi:hypothetical protein